MKKSKIQVDIEDAKNLIDIQLTSGNYDYNMYLYGMTIGLITMYNCAYGEDTEKRQYPEPPKRWISEEHLDAAHDDNPTLKDAYDNYMFLVKMILGDDSEECARRVNEKLSQMIDTAKR